MGFIWFIVAVVFLILLLNSKKSQPSRDDEYGRGFWDGYRDFGAKVQQELKAQKVDKNALRALIDVGLGGTDLDVSGEPVMHQTSHSNQSQQQLHTDKEEQSLKNLNALLFVASLLLVAAGAALVAASMPDAVKLVGVWLLVVAFYGVGMALHYTSHRLKPAAVAFLGTGLGLVPFAGVALYQLAGVDPAVAWCVTSFIGVVAYFWAAIRLQSQIVSYLTLAFVISLASSFATSASLPIVWSFVLIIVVSLAANIVAFIKPTWLPKVFSEPIERTGQLVTPLALVASLFVYDQVSLLSYEIVFAVATLHYVVAWLQSREFVYETAVRILAHLTLLIAAWDVTNGEGVPFGLVFLGLATSQQLYSFVAHTYSSKVPRARTEQLWISSMQGAQIISIIFWLEYQQVAELSCLALVAVGISSLMATRAFRDIRHASQAVAVSVVLPFVVARGVFEPALDWEYIAAIMILGSAGCLTLWRTIMMRSQTVRQFFIGSYVVYVAVAALLASAVTETSSAIILAILVLLLWVGTYIMKVTQLSFAGNVLFMLTILQAWRAIFGFDGPWLVLGVAWISASVLYAAHWILVLRRDTIRSFGLLVSTWGVLTFGTLLSFFDTDLRLAAAVTIIIIAATIGVEGYRRQHKTMMEAAVYIAMFGLQRCIGITFPDLNIVFYAHWWALSVAAIAVWRREMTTRLIVAMSFITASTGVYALSEGGFYQLLFLVEHLALLVAGALLSKRWAIWWGITASSISVLYFLKDIAFLAFGFLGLLLIAIVVWRLSKTQSNNE